MSSKVWIRARINKETFDNLTARQARDVTHGSVIDKIVAIYSQYEPEILALKDHWEERHNEFQEQK